MRYLTSTIVLTILLSSIGYAQVEWSNVILNDDSFTTWQTISDINNSIISAGEFRTSISSSGTTCVSHGNHDGFVHKLNSSGGLEWMVPVGGAGNDNIRGIATDTVGNLYLTGYFTDSMDADPSSNTHYIDPIGLKSMYLLKLDAGANFQWVKQFGGTGGTYPENIDIDSQNNIIISGGFSGPTDFDPGADTFNLVGSNLTSSKFVLKLDSNGNFVWAGMLENSNLVFINDIELDNEDNIYLTGRFRDTIRFDLFNQASFAVPSYLDYTSFLWKLNEMGTTEWVHSAQGGISAGSAVSCTSDSLLYWGGEFSDTVDFGIANNSDINISGLYDDAFVQKITVSGIPIWTKTYGGGNSILKTDDLISIDTQGLVIAGTFKNTCNFDPNGGSELVSSITQINTTSDGYVLFLSSNGEFEWVRRLGGSEAGHALLDLSRDGNESLYLSGLFIGTTYFNDISYGDSISSVSLQAGCGFTFKLGETLRASSVENSSEYSLFPNPANEWIEIENLETPKEYVLTNSLGKKILSGILNNGQQIDVSPLPKGMYFVRILQSENMTMLPLIVN